MPPAAQRTQSSPAPHPLHLNPISANVAHGARFRVVRLGIRLRAAQPYVLTLVGVKVTTTRDSPGRSFLRKSAPYLAPIRSAKAYSRSGTISARARTSSVR